MKKRIIFFLFPLTVLAQTIVNPGNFVTSGGVSAPTSGTVTSVSVVTANGVSGSVANPTTTPAITLTLGAITPSSIATSGIIASTNATSGTSTTAAAITGKSLGLTENLFAGGTTNSAGGMFVTGSVGYRYDYSNPDVQAFIYTATTGTNAVAGKFVNTGGNYFIGVDSSTGTRIQNGSAIGYAIVINAETAHPILLMTGNTLRATVGQTGGLNVGSTGAEAGAGNIVADGTLKTAAGVAYNFGAFTASEPTGTAGNLAVTVAGTSYQIPTGPTAQVSFGRVTAQTGAVATVKQITVGASDASYIISANVNVTASATNSFTSTCTYTDETNTSRVLTLTFSNLTGTLLQTITNVTGTGAYEGVPLHIRAKASTTITIGTTGTFTSVTYNAEGAIDQIN